MVTLCSSHFFVKIDFFVCVKARVTEPGEEERQKFISNMLFYLPNVPSGQGWPSCTFFFFMWMPGAQALVPPSSEVLGALARKCI